MAKAGLVPLRKVVQNKATGKSYVRLYWVKPNDLTNMRDKQRFDSKDAHTDSKGIYTSERFKKHGEIVDKLLASCPLPKAGERPKAILLMGGAASGKSTVVKKYLIPKYGEGAFGVLNADDIKEEIPEYDQYTKQDVETAASRVHEESSDISKKALKEITTQGRNFIYDAVLGNPKKAEKIINDLKALGYDVELVGVTVDTEQAWNRAVKRAFGEDDKEDGSGRYVPDGPFFEGHRGVVDTFKDIKSKVDDFVLFDNNVSWGEDPILIEDSAGVKDQARKKSFEDKSDVYAEDVLKKAFEEVDLLDFVAGYETICKAFDSDEIGSEVFKTAKQVFSDVMKSIAVGQSISFGEEAYNQLSVNDLMEAIADGKGTQHYCDAIIQNSEGKILLLQRSSGDSFEAGKWCLAGGKAENGEFLRDSVKRELLEETCLIASTVNYSTLYKNTDGSFSHYFWVYVEDLDLIGLDSSEHQNYAFVTLDQLEQYDLMLDLTIRIKEIFGIPFKGKYLTDQEYSAIAEKKIQKANTETSLEKSYEKGCLMLDINWISREGDDKWDEVLRLIDPLDVYDESGFGKEDRPHITVLYGFKLPEVTADHIERILPEEQVVFSIADVSYFESENYDVLKFGIHSEQLHFLNSLYRVLPHQNSHPDYKPHCTIAYLKKGKAEKYIDKLKNWVNHNFQSSKFDYSHNDENGLKTKTHWDVKGFETKTDPINVIQKAKTYNIGEISQQTGLKKVAPNKWVDPKTGKPVSTDENGTPKNPKTETVDTKSMSDEDIAGHAKNSSESELQTAIKENRDSKIRTAAQNELDRREKEEKPQEEKEEKEEKEEEPKFKKNKETGANEVDWDYLLGLSPEKQREYAKQMEEANKKLQKEPAPPKEMKFTLELDPKGDLTKMRRFVRLFEESPKNHFDEKTTNDYKKFKKAIELNEKKNEKEDEELSEIEKASVYDYTNRDFEEINISLNEGNVSEKTQKKIDLLSKSIAKLPDFKGTAYRSIQSFQGLNNHFSDFNKNLGGEIEFPSFSSSSADKAISAGFGFEILFEITSKSGKDISSMGRFPSEQEILFDKGSRFIVKNVKKTMDGKKIKNLNIILEQI